MGIIIDPSKIIGRVMAHEKPADFAFTEEDFLPFGTSPGIAGGTPPGKRASPWTPAISREQATSMRATTSICTPASRWTCRGRATPARRAPWP